jgi:Domain of unknown function (DUF4823)
MIMRREVLVSIIAFVLAGCASSYKSVTHEPLAAKLEAHASFYVLLPADGQYGSKTYPNSGLATAHAIAQALASHADKVVEASSVEDLATALTNAKQGKIRYVFETTILGWEDRATEWSGLPDKVSLKFSVYDTGTGRSLAATVVNASSKWATFGGDHPQDLLPEMTQAFVDSLF